MAAGQKEVTAPPAPAQASKPSRAASVREQAGAVSDPRDRYVLAPALDGQAGKWHTTPDGGHVGVTRAVNGEVVRDYVTYIPARGRVSGIPLFALDAHPELDV